MQQNHVRKRGSSWQRRKWGGVSILVPRSPALAWEAQWEKHFLCGWSITLADVEPDQESPLDNSCNVCRCPAGCAGTLRSCWDTLQERACKHCQRAEAACTAAFLEKKKKSSVEVLNVFKWSWLQMTQMTVFLYVKEWWTQLLFQDMQWIPGLGTAWEVLGHRMIG